MRTPVLCLALAIAALARANLLADPSFEQFPTDWQFDLYPAEGVAPTATFTPGQGPAGNRFALVQVTLASTVDWAVELKQNGIRLSAGQTYELEARMSCPVDRPLQFALVGIPAGAAKVVLVREQVVCGPGKGTNCVGGFCSYAVQTAVTTGFASARVKFEMGATTDAQPFKFQSAALRVVPPGSNPPPTPTPPAAKPAPATPTQGVETPTPPTPTLPARTPSPPTPTPTVNDPTVEMPCGGGPGAWSETFSDEFDGDLSKWEVYNSPGHAGNGLRRPEAFSVSNSKVVITAKENAAGATVSGGMSVKATNYQTYGCYVARVRTDVDPSESLSGVLITWPEDYAAEQWENDYYETLSNAARKPLYAFFHSKTALPQAYMEFPDVDASEWHTVAMEWLPDVIKVYIDGQFAGETRDLRFIPQIPMRQTVQLDKKNLNPMNGNTVKMEVDFVRIYEKVGGY